MDCPHRIPPSGTPATHHKSHKGHHSRSNLRHHCEDREDEADPDHSPHFTDITAHVTVIHTEATLDCNTEIDATTTGAVHDDLIQPTENTHRPHHDTLHQSHCRSSQNQSSSGYQY